MRYLRPVAAVILTAVIGLAGPASAERRIALVIGNGDYLHTTTLANPVNDARAMSMKLEELGFETYSGYDLDRPGMVRLLRDFARASRESDINLFFYAGHGMSVNGTNYLVPVDAAFEDETALDFEAVEVGFITDQMTNSDAVNLVFLDACRDNPLSRSLSRSMETRSVSIGAGLSEMKVQSTGKGMAIAFSTSPGEVALDGDGVNSPFTTALLNHIGAPNTDISEVFSRVTGDVYETTGQAQRPWLNVSLTGPVVLNPVEIAAQPQVAALDATAPASVPAADAVAMLEHQKLLFDLARESGQILDYEAYLATFPNGLFANNARAMIAKLRAEQRAPQQLAAAVQPNRLAPGQRMAQPEVSRGIAIDEDGPLVLSVTPSIRALAASEYTENDLDLDRTAKGVIQSRLNATGSSVGAPDGLWGRKTRAGIGDWQMRNGLQPTGYLNRAQLELLVSQTEGRYQPYVAPQPVAKRQRTSSAPRKTVRRQSNDDAGKALGAAIIGLTIGKMLSK